MKNKLISCSYYLMILIMIVTGTYVMINWLIPLFFSCLIVLILQPLLAKEVKLLKIKNKLVIQTITVLNYLLFIMIIIGIIIFSVIQVYKILELLPDYLSYLYNLFSHNHYVLNASKYLDFLYTGSMSLVEKVTSSFITSLITVIMKIPSILFDLVFVITTSLFILLDYHRIERLLIKKYNLISLVIDTIKDVLSNMFKASFIIMIITFIELWLGLTFLKVEQSMMLACIIAIFDFMPVLGIDMIMIPWIVILALMNRIPFAIGLLIVYMVVIITKNILEPKLLAKNLGISPVISLVGMYLGIKLMGIMGVIVVPTMLLIIIQVIRVKWELKNTT